ncbi:MAG: hypothetical protein IJM90_08370 [Firmicutes bacterium]|nr:hypothetical protein [Bacillota bacterium]
MKKKWMMIIIVSLFFAFAAFLAICFRKTLLQREVNAYLRLVGTDQSREVSREQQTYYLEQQQRYMDSHTDLSGAYSGLPGYADMGQSDTEMTLPFDLHYYAAPDDKEPVYTIVKGSKVLRSRQGRGYGFQTFPTDQKEWRVAHPFTAGKDEVLQGAYYMKWADIQKLYTAVGGVSVNENTLRYLNQNLGFKMSKNALQTIILCGVDQQLLSADLFRSDNLAQQAAPLWLLAAAALLCVEILAWCLYRLIPHKKPVIKKIPRPVFWGLLALDALVLVLLAFNVRNTLYNSKLEAAIPARHVTGQTDYMGMITGRQNLTTGLLDRMMLDSEPGLSRLELSFDLNYYAKPGDASPILTIPKGTIICLTDKTPYYDSKVDPRVNHYAFESFYGYGLMSFPTDRAGWRFAHPFWTEGQRTYEGPYYVRLSDLRRVAQAWYDTDTEAIACEESWGGKTITLREYIAEEASQIGLSEKDYLNYWTTLVDGKCMRADWYRSKDLFKCALPGWLGAVVTVLFLQVNLAVLIWLLIRLRKRKVS